MTTRRPTDRVLDPAMRSEAIRPRARTRRASPAQRLGLTTETRRNMIAECAYLRAERRGFVPGYEVEDWLAAEAEVDALLREHGGAAQ